MELFQTYPVEQPREFDGRPATTLTEVKAHGAQGPTHVDLLVKCIQQFLQGHKTVQLQYNRENEGDDNSWMKKAVCLLERDHYFVRGGGRGGDWGFVWEWMGLRKGSPPKSRCGNRLF